MGVLACDRKGCDNIMCDTLIDNYYICYECKAEFESKIGDGSFSEAELFERFAGFMETRKSHHSEDKMITVDDFFRLNDRQK